MQGVFSFGKGRNSILCPSRGWKCLFKLQSALEIVLSLVTERNLKSEKKNSNKCEQDKAFLVSALLLHPSGLCSRKTLRYTACCISLNFQKLYRDFDWSLRCRAAIEILTKQFVLRTGMWNRKKPSENLIDLFGENNTFFGHFLMLLILSSTLHWLSCRIKGSR